METTEIVLTMLGDGLTTLGLMRGSGADLGGRLLLQMDTIAPSESRALGRWLADQVATIWKRPCWAASLKRSAAGFW